jgi:hypothetical protein
MGAASLISTSMIGGLGRARTRCEPAAAAGYKMRSSHSPVAQSHRTAFAEIVLRRPVIAPSEKEITLLIGKMSSWTLYARKSSGLNPCGSSISPSLRCSMVRLLADEALYSDHLRAASHVRRSDANRLARHESLGVNHNPIASDSAARVLVDHNKSTCSAEGAHGIDRSDIAGGLAGFGAGVRRDWHRPFVSRIAGET